MPKNPSTNIGISVSVDKKTLDGVFEIIKMILDNQNSDQATKQAALSAATQMTSIHNTNITGNSVCMGDK